MRYKKMTKNQLIITIKDVEDKNKLNEDKSTIQLS